MHPLSRAGTCVAFLACCIALAPCHAAGTQDVSPDAKISLLPAASEVIVTGYPDGDGSLTGRITLIADQKVDALIFHPSDLQHAGDAQILYRTQIKLVAGGPGLAQNTAQDFDFKVGGIKFPGTYAGALDFLQANHGTSAVLHVPLKLIVQETPVLTVRSGSESVRVQLTNCSLLRCFVGGFGHHHASPDKALPAEKNAVPVDKSAVPFDNNTLPVVYSFPLNNDSQLKFSLTGSVSAVGDTRHLGTGDSVALKNPIEVEPVPIVSIPFQVASGGLAPDHYTGEFRLRMPGRSEALKIPLQLDVRDGPELAVLVLIVGILLGRFTKYMNDVGTPQSDLLKQFLQLQSRAQQDASDYELLQPSFHEARLSIDSLKLDAAKATLALIDDRLTLIARLRYLATLLTTRADEAPVEAILDKIAIARNNIALGTDPTDIAKQIEDAVKNLPPPQGVQNPTGSNTLEVAAAGSLRSAARASVTVTDESTRVKPSWQRRLTSLITGHTDALRADLTLWFLRPLAWLILILLLVATGFMQLYLKNPSFGANSVADYFGLLLWGMGSDVAGRTLTSFKGT